MQCICALWPKRLSTARNCWHTLIVNKPLFNIYHRRHCLILNGWKIKVISASTETFNYDDISSIAVFKVWNNPASCWNWCSELLRYLFMRTPDNRLSPCIFIKKWYTYVLHRNQINVFPNASMVFIVNLPTIIFLDIKTSRLVKDIYF